MVTNAGRSLIADQETWTRDNGGEVLGALGFDVDTVSTGHDLLRWFDRHRRSRRGGRGYSVDLDLLVLGCNLLLEHGGQLVGPVRSRIGARAANTPVLILTTYECREVCFRAWRLPIVATMAKPFEATELGDRVGAVLNNGAQSRRSRKRKKEPDPLRGLTDREHTVLSLVCHGLTDQEIGKCLDISVQTVHTHVKRLIDKLGVKNRTEAAALKSAGMDLGTD